MNLLQMVDQCIFMAMSQICLCVLQQSLVLIQLLIQLERMDWSEDSDQQHLQHYYPHTLGQISHQSDDDEEDDQQADQKHKQTPFETILLDEQNVMCQICCKYALNAVVCVNSKCHKLFCTACFISTKKTIQDKCPFCRSDPFECRASPHAININQMRLVCPHCKQHYVFAEELSHYKTQCSYFKKVQCHFCEQKMAQKQILAHTKLKHMDKMHQIIQKLYAQPAPILNHQLVINKNAAYLEAIGKRPRLGTTGKFYCGGKLETKCVCCNGYCGPTNGQNCIECMKLDIQRLGLKKGYLVNSSGNVCWKKGQDYVCGTLIYSSQIRCGQGAICKRCSNMKKNIKRYQDLI